MTSLLDTGVLIVIAGPTATGKTKWAIELAQALETEIISFDSRQFYKEMSIGTAVPSAVQRHSVPHHFIQHLSVTDHYDVATYEKEALLLLQKLFAKHKYVVAVGGSGLFIHALIHGMDELPGSKEDIRNHLLDTFKTQGINVLQQDLLKLDPEYYREVDLNNPSRIIRALEVCLISGKPYSSFRTKKGKARSFGISAWALHVDRPVLHAQINERVDGMIEMGLLEEAKTLLPYRHHNALQTLGYQEMFSFLDGELSWDQAIEKIKTNTRRYAKRQITWFRRDATFLWVNPEQLMKAIQDSGIAIAPPCV